MTRGDVGTSGRLTLKGRALTTAADRGQAFAIARKWLRALAAVQRQYARLPLPGEPLGTTRTTAADDPRRVVARRKP